MNKKCEGCSLGIKECLLSYFLSKSDIKCPCYNCIIKIVCKKECDDFQNFEVCTLNKMESLDELDTRKTSYLYHRINEKF